MVCLFGSFAIITPALAGLIRFAMWHHRPHPFWNILWTDEVKVEMFDDDDVDDWSKANHSKNNCQSWW